MKKEDIVIGKKYYCNNYKIEFTVLGITPYRLLGQRVDNAGWEIGQEEMKEFNLGFSFKGQKAYYFQYRDIQEIKTEELILNKIVKGDWIKITTKSEEASNVSEEMRKLDGMVLQIPEDDDNDFRMIPSIPHYYWNKRQNHYRLATKEEIESVLCEKKEKSLYTSSLHALIGISTERQKISTDADYAYQIKKKSIVLEPILPIKTRVLI